MRFEWDGRKNASNRRKHGVSFEVAAAVFDDPLHLSEQDQVVDGELRWRTIGKVNGQDLLIVAHTIEFEDVEVIRIISAREATPQERRDYEGNV